MKLTIFAVVAMVMATNAMAPRRILELDGQQLKEFQDVFRVTLNELIASTVDTPEMSDLEEDAEKCKAMLDANMKSCRECAKSTCRGVPDVGDDVEDNASPEADEESKSNEEKRLFLSTVKQYVGTISKEDIADAWNNAVGSAKGHFSSAWNSVFGKRHGYGSSQSESLTDEEKRIFLSTLTGYVGGLNRDDVVNAWNAAKQKASDVAGAVKGHISSAWNSVIGKRSMKSESLTDEEKRIFLSTLTGYVGNLNRDDVVNAWNAAKQTVSDAAGTVKGHISSVWNSVFGKRFSQLARAEDSERKLYGKRSIQINADEALSDEEKSVFMSTLTEHNGDIKWEDIKNAWNIAKASTAYGTVKEHLSSAWGMLGKRGDGHRISGSEGVNIGYPGGQSFDHPSCWDKCEACRPFIGSDPIGTVCGPKFRQGIFTVASGAQFLARLKKVNSDIAHPILIKVAFREADPTEDESPILVWARFPSGIMGYESEVVFRNSPDTAADLAREYYERLIAHHE